MDLLDKIKQQVRKGEYAVSDHAIIEARKDGIDPKTIEKLEKVVLNGKIIEEYPERQRVLIFGLVDEGEPAGTPAMDAEKKRILLLNNHATMIDGRR